MTVRAVLTYPNKCLRQKAESVPEVNDDVRALVQDLKDTCRAYRANGLAAPQIGISSRVFVTQVNESEPTVFINPEIVNPEDHGFEMKEGCLSFPGVEEIITRFGDVTIRALDVNGVEFTLSLDGLEAVAVQHEYDHLDGVLFIDHVSSLKRRFMLKKLKKIMKKYNRR